ncbi:MAG: TATA-box-binding protein [Methanomicrobiales archaeon]|nr:TATA-box-binding protein [Methanomicrobiales archaeon]
MKNKEKYPSLKIQNMVMTGRIADSLDIQYIADKLDGCTYTKKKFPGAVYHMKEPKIVALLFNSGKIVLTGITCKDDFQKGLKVLTSQLNGLGVRTLAVPDISVKNMVCSYDTGLKISLARVIATFTYEKIEYEPEQFPGLVFRIAEPKIVILIFSSGKIVLTGGTNIEDVKSAIDQLMKKLTPIC